MDLEKFINWCLETYKLTSTPEKNSLNTIWLAVDPGERRWEIYDKEPNLIEGEGHGFWEYPGFIFYVGFDGDWGGAFFESAPSIDKKCIPQYNGFQYLKFKIK